MYIDTNQIQEFEKEHIKRLRQDAPECMVLLKSDGTFPLSSPRNIALYGSGARRTIKGGTGSGDVNVRHFVTVEEGLENAGFTITTKAWLDEYDKIKEKAHKEFVSEIKARAKEEGVPSFLLGMGAVMPEPEYDLMMDGAGDTALYILARISGEGSDRNNQAGDMKLTETEIRDIMSLSQSYKKFLLVLNVGGVIDLTELHDIKNILLLSQLGMVTGDAFVDVILGKSYPSGKLSVSWASPNDYSEKMEFGHPDDTPYREGIYVGYRYFDSVNKTPSFPFGYGLGYTSFAISQKDFKLDGRKVMVRVEVKNTGSHPGKEVVQLYYSSPKGSLDKPYQELVAFDKTKELKEGDSQVITLSFNLEEMASYETTTASFILEKGSYYLRVGNSSRDTQICGAVILEQDVITKRLSNIGGKPEIKDWIPEEAQFSYETEEIEKKKASKITVYSEKNLTSKKDNSKNVIEESKKVKELLESLSLEEMTYLCIGSFKEEEGKKSIIGNSSFSVAGAAGETTSKLKDREIGSLVMADGPAGLRLNTEFIKDGDIAYPVNDTVPAAFLDYIDDLRKYLSFEEPSEEETEKFKDKKKYYQYCSAIPIGMALAQSWNEELCETCGDIVGKEMKIFGIHLWLAPALNIHRSPLCGRNFEYYSEDPYLSGKVAAAVTIGVQNHKGCGATIKHYACNNQETNRFHSNSILSERALREIYLKGFEICVKESQPHALMTSYNLVNGEHACNRMDLVTEVLRNEWNYEGIVMTDWGVTGGMSKKTKYPAASSAGCIKAGNDLIMPGTVADKEDILDALSNENHSYSLDENDLKECAKRVLTMIYKLRLQE